MAVRNKCPPKLGQRGLLFTTNFLHRLDSVSPNLSRLPRTLEVMMFRHGSLQV